MRKSVQQDMRSQLECNDNSSGDDGLSDFTGGLSLGGNAFSSSSALYVKMNSNLYAFDALIFLVIVRVYSGHGTEREQILASACEFQLNSRWG